MLDNSLIQHLCVCKVPGGRIDQAKCNSFIAQTSKNQSCNILVKSAPRVSLVHLFLLLLTKLFLMATQLVKKESKRSQTYLLVCKATFEVTLAHKKKLRDNATTRPVKQLKSYLVPARMQPTPQTSSE